MWLEPCKYNVLSKPAFCSWGYGVPPQLRFNAIPSIWFGHIFYWKISIHKSCIYIYPISFEKIQMKKTFHGWQSFFILTSACSKHPPSLGPALESIFWGIVQKQSACVFLFSCALRAWPSPHPCTCCWHLGWASSFCAHECNGPADEIWDGSSNISLANSMTSQQGICTLKGI